MGAWVFLKGLRMRKCYYFNSVTIRDAANEQLSTRVLVDTGNALIYAVNDEERVVGQRT